MDAEKIYELIETQRVKLGFSQSEVSKRALGKVGSTPIQALRRGSSPTAETLSALCRALGLEFYIGPPRGVDVDLPLKPILDLTRFGEVKLPHRGLAKCAINGWGKDQPLSDPLPGPEGLTDKDAFYVSATGQSMIPEGIDGGAFCLVSPTVEPREGDRVWLLDGSGAATIKRLVKVGEKSVTLRGWMPVQNRKQKSFEDERFTNYIKALHPVIAVFNGEPGSDACEYVPDPKPPAHAMDLDTGALIPKAVTDLLGLPENADPSTVVEAMRVQLADRGTAHASQTETRSLRDEMSAVIESQTDALRSEMKAIRDDLAVFTSDPVGGQSVRVAGYTVNSGRIVFDDRLGQAPAPAGDRDGMIAIEIRDGAVPCLRSGDRVYFRPDRPCDPQEQTGRLVAATAANGNVYIGTLQRGNHAWTLETNAAIRDVALSDVVTVEWVCLG